MNEENLNAENEVVVQPQQENGAEDTNVSQGGFTAPDYDSMSDEEFADYINSAKSGTVSHGEVQAESQETQSGEAGPADDSNKAPEDGRADEVKPFKSFATQEEYQSELDRIIGERLKKTREGKEQLDSILQQAGEFYGSEDATEIVKRLVDDLRSQNADKRGMDVDTYTKNQQDAIDAKRYREQQRAQEEREQKIQQIRERWMSEAEELKKVVPSFSFEKAIENKRFYDLITDGQSVSMAYLACNNAAAESNSSNLGDTHKRRSIAQNGNARGGGSGTVEFNPETASDADFQKYIDKIRDRR